MSAFDIDLRLPYSGTILASLVNAEGEKIVLTAQDDGRVTWRKVVES